MSISPLRRIIALAVLGSTLLVPTAILDTASAADAPCVVSFGATDTRAIPDPGTLNLLAPVSSSETVTDVDVAVDVTHGYDSDLAFELRHGSFTITLANRVGGTGDNYTGTIFDDEATSSITTAAPPFSGPHRPETPLSSFDGATASGEWALIVRDALATDAGTLNSFRVTITIADCDSDADGVKNSVDNCDLVANSSQVDTDKDGEGDLCDSDNDGDAVPDATDNCDFVVNPSQVDFDHDGIGDACDADRDGDALVDAVDNCNSIPNPDQLNTDADALGNACDADDDGDGYADTIDSCRLLAAAGHSGCPLATRKLFLKERHDRLKGRVTSPVPGCAAGRTVVVRGLTASGRTFRRVAVTGDDGRFRIRRDALPGRYRAATAAGILGGVAYCEQARSSWVRVD